MVMLLSFSKKYLKGEIAYMVNSCFEKGMKESIEKLEREIQEKQEIIELIKRFNELSFSDKLFAIKTSWLRTERQELPQIMQKEFKSKVLKDGQAYFRPNEFQIKVDGYSFEIGFGFGKYLKIEADNKVRTMQYDRKKMFDESDEKLFNQIKLLTRFSEKPSLKNYKEYWLYQSETMHRRVYLLNYFLFKRKTVQNLNERLSTLRHSVLLQKLRFSENYMKVVENDELKLKHQEFLTIIKDDLDYFKSEGYHIHLNFSTI